MTAQLISTQDGYAYWSETYARPLREGQSLQAELGQEISTRTRTEMSRLVQSEVRTWKPQAQDLQRRARESLQRGSLDHLILSSRAASESRSLAELMEVIEGFKAAIAIEPGYGLAWAGLAGAYNLAADFDARLGTQAREAAERAVRLDERLAEAHYVLGYHSYFREWNFVRAEKELKRATSLDHRWVTSFRLYADVSMLLGNAAAGAAELQRAKEIYPNSPVLELAIGALHYNRRQYQEAAAQARLLQGAFPEFPLGFWLLGLVYEQMGRLQDAEAELKKCLQLSPGDRRATPALGHLYGLMGRKAEARRIIDDLRGQAPERSNAPTLAALIYAGLGDREKAIHWLQQALEGRDNALPYMKTDPRVDSLRADPRFAAIMKQLGL